MPILNGCAISNNNATFVQGQTASFGGGCLIQDEGSIAKFTNCTISGNRALYGGGISLRTAGDSTIVSTEISGNGLPDHDANGVGGGVFGEGAGTNPKFEDCNITDNYASWGGGAAFATGSQPSFTDSNIQNNQAVTAGGGILATATYTEPKLLRTKVSHNSALFGGGIASHTGSSNYLLDDNSA